MNYHHHHHPPLVPPPPEPGDAIDAVTAEAFHSLGKVFHLHRQAMQRRLGNPETHHGELISMRLLARTEGMSQRDLAETLHLSRSRVTSILQGLEKAGAVRREPDADDQRVTRVFLTDEGRRREMENRADFEDYINRTIGALSETDKVEMARILDLVSDHIAELVCAGTKEQEGRVAL